MPARTADRRAVLFAEAELKRGRADTRRLPELFARKVARMSASPLAFLRGAAPMFPALLGKDLAGAVGAAGEGWLVGDLHVENYGAFRTAHPSHGEHGLSFDLNDFDDATVGPWRYDVLRLATSALLAALRVPGAHPSRLVKAILEGHREGLATGRPGTEPLPVTALLARAALRTRLDLLDSRTEVVRGDRRFVLADRYRALPAPARKALPKAFATALASMGAPAGEEAFELVDAAWRIAGTGSLGVLRVAVLVRGKGGRDGHWMFELKEARAPALAGAQRFDDQAVRVVTAARAMLRVVPPLLGTTTLTGRPMIARRLAPQDDKLELASLPVAQLEPLVAFLGRLAGAGHRRGAAGKVRPWSDQTLRTLADLTWELAGAHVAAWGAFCDRAPAAG